MGDDLWIVEYRSSVIRRDNEFYDWLEHNFQQDSGNCWVCEEDFESAVKEETAAWRKKFKEVIGEVRQQFKLERKRLPVKDRHTFHGFSFNIG